MNKQELVAAMAEKAGLTKADSEKALNAFTAAVADALSAGQSVQLVGFGTFAVSERSARTGKNPRTGAKLQIAAKKVAKCKLIKSPRLRAFFCLPPRFSLASKLKTSAAQHGTFFMPVYCRLHNKLRRICFKTHCCDKVQNTRRRPLADYNRLIAK